MVQLNLVIAPSSLGFSFFNQHLQPADHNAMLGIQNQMIEVVQTSLEKKDYTKSNLFFCQGEDCASMDWPSSSEQAKC